MFKSVGSSCVLTILDTLELLDATAFIPNVGQIMDMVNDSHRRMGKDGGTAA